MQTAAASLQNHNKTDSVETGREKGTPGMAPKSMESAPECQGLAFLMELLSQHMTADSSSGRLNDTLNEMSFESERQDRSLIKNVKIDNFLSPDTAKLETIQKDESISKVFFKQNAEIIGKLSELSSRSNSDVTEKGHTKAGESNQISSNIVFRKTTADVDGTIRVPEPADRKMELVKNNSNQLQSKSSPDSENNAQVRFMDGSNMKASSVAARLETWQQYLNINNGIQKPQTTDGSLLVNKVIHSETIGGEETALASSNHVSEKNMGSDIQLKEVSQFHRQFEPVVMRQLVEKTFLGIENGRSLIKINLKPELFGHLRMKISTEKNQVAIRIITEAPIVKEIIENNLNQLRADFQNQGLEIEKFNVFVDPGSDQNDRGPAYRLGQNQEGKTDDDKSEQKIPEKEEGNIMNTGKSSNSALIDFFA